jgi:SAM-dependent methyltransferase
MDATYGQQYRNLHENHWWWRSRERYVLDIITDMGLSGGANILDIGCGDGLFFDALSKFGTPFGVEPDGTLLSDTRWQNHIFQTPFDETFRPDRRYRLILLLDVLEHLDGDLSALRQAVDLLEPDGKIVVTVPAMMSAWTAHDTVNHHRRRYRKSQFKSLCESAGLKVTHCRYYFVWTYFPKILLSLKEGILGLPSSETQTQIPPKIVNAALEGVSYFEHRLLHTLPVPFGTSLIAVGERN